MVSQGQTNEETKEKDSKQSKIQWKQKAMLGEMHHLSRSTMVNIQKTKSTRRSQRRRIDRRKRDLEQKKVENIDGRHWMLLDRHVYGGVGVLNENIMEMKTVLLLVVMVVAGHIYEGEECPFCGHSDCAIIGDTAMRYYWQCKNRICFAELCG
eukprot:40437_1